MDTEKVITQARSWLGCNERRRKWTREYPADNIGIIAS